MKKMLEGQPVTRVTREHLDRCLTCRNRETTCPSGVQYGRLIDIGRAAVEQLSSRPLGERLLRMGLRRTLASPMLFGSLLKLGRGVSWALPATRVSSLTLDLAEVLAREDLSHLRRGAPRRIAFHPPCSLQHGQKVRGVIEAILVGLGHELVPVTDSHLCCGSAGTYSLLQPELSGQLRERKLTHLQAAKPDLIATANIGCQSHLAAAGGVPVVHWITLLENAPS